MKKYSIFLILLFNFFAQLNAQNIRFYFTTEIQPNTAIVSVYAQSIGAPEQMLGCDIQFYYQGPTPDPIVDFSPVSNVGGLDWGVQSSLIVSGTNGNILMPHDRFFSCSLIDNNFNFTIFTAIPTLLFTLTFPTTAPPEFGYLASTSESPAIAYTDGNFDVQSVVIIGSQQQILPIELLRLTANAGLEDINVEWATAQEIDFSHFDLERSTDGLVFEKITEVDGKGATQNDYSYLDEVVEPGINYYYRLKMNDVDGAFSYSHIVQAAISGKDQVIVNMSPNPTDAYIYVEYLSPEDTDIRFKILDLNGRVLENRAVASLKGANVCMLDLSTYASGIYMLILEDGDLQVSRKIVKAE